MAKRIDYDKLSFNELRLLRDKIEADPASRNRVGPFLYSSRTIERLDRVHELVTRWPRKPAEKGK